MRQLRRITSRGKVTVAVISLGEFCPRGKDAMRLTLCKAPTSETRPDYNTGNYVPSKNSVFFCDMSLRPSGFKGFKASYFTDDGF